MQDYPNNIKNGLWSRQRLLLNFHIANYCRVKLGLVSHAEEFYFMKKSMQNIFIIKSVYFIHCKFPKDNKL